MSQVTDAAQARAQHAGDPGEWLDYPISVEGLTEDWLIQALGAARPDIRIHSAKHDGIIWGTATKVFVDVEYSQRESDQRLRQRLCFKGAFDEKMRNYYDLSVLYTTEAAFYRDIAPKLDIVLPACWLAIENRKEGIIALEDLGARGVTFMSASDVWAPDAAAQMLLSLAKLHGATWGWKAGTLPWITLGSGAQRGGLTAMMAVDRFDALTERPEVKPFMPKELTEQADAMAALNLLWKQDDASDVLTLCHGDAHLGQTYVEPDGRRGLLDWQSPAVMPWAKDIAYFIGGALSIADRRATERDLLEYYLRELEQAGGPALDRAAAWHEYRRQMISGMVWPVVIENMQPIEAIATMNERYLTAMTDLNAVDALRNPY